MIGKRLRSIRMERMMSLNEVSQRSGIAKSYISTIERHLQGNSSLRVMEKLADFLEVEVQDLVDEPGYGSTQWDDEWRALFTDVVSSGISKEEFREYVEFNKWRKNRRFDDVENL